MRKLVLFVLFASAVGGAPAAAQGLEQIARQCREEAMVRRGYPKDTPTNSRTANVGRGFQGEVDQCIAERSRGGAKSR